MKKLNLGCGKDYKEGYINIDFKSGTKADIYHDLNISPYPFKDNSINEVLMIHSLEHLNASVVFKELYRICKNKAKLVIEVPFSINGFNHIQHTQQFNWDTFKTLNSDYLPFKFKLIKQTPKIDQKKGIGKIRKLIPLHLIKMLSYFFPVICQNIYIELKVIK